mgnify:CR=1 FL=1
MKSNIEEYINIQDWILDHYQALNLNASEAIVLLQLEHHLRKNRHIDPKILSVQCQLSVKELDKILTLLIQKGLLKVDVSNLSVSYTLQNLFEVKKSNHQDVSQDDLISLFEREFKRPLSTHEIDKLNDWLMKVDYGFIVHALREAIIYQKLSLNYIDRILVKWLNDGVKLEDLDAGNK